jgi:hypothetical protein
MPHPFEFRTPDKQLGFVFERDYRGDKPVRFDQIQGANSGPVYIRAALSFTGPKWRTVPLTEAELALYDEVSPYLDQYYAPVYHDDGILVLCPDDWPAAQRMQAEAERQRRREQHVFDFHRARYGIEEGDLSDKQQADAWRSAENYVQWHHVDLDLPIQPQLDRRLVDTTPRPLPGGWEFPEWHERLAEPADEPEDDDQPPVPRNHENWRSAAPAWRKHAFGTAVIGAPIAKQADAKSVAQVDQAKLKQHVTWEFPDEGYPEHPDPPREGQEPIRMYIDDDGPDDDDRPGKQGKKARKKAKKQATKQAKDAKQAATDQGRPAPQPVAPRAPRLSDEELEIVREQRASGTPMTEITDRLNQYLIEQGRAPLTRPGLRYLIEQRR